MGRKKLPAPEKYCERCGKKLERRPLSNGYEEPLYWFNRRRFCSVDCANKAKAEVMLQEPAPTEKQGRARARNAVPDAPCAICGKAGYTEVHHIDGNPLNNSSENLVRLCKSCHAKQHRKRSSCVVCGMPVKGHHLCSKHWQAWRKSIKRGWDTDYTFNPHSGFYEAETSRTLDPNGGNPACNQGGICVVELHNRSHHQ